MVPRTIGLKFLRRVSRTAGERFERIQNAYILRSSESFGSRFLKYFFGVMGSSISFRVVFGAFSRLQKIQKAYTICEHENKHG